MFRRGYLFKTLTTWICKLCISTWYAYPWDSRNAQNPPSWAFAITCLGSNPKNRKPNKPRFFRSWHNSGTCWLSSMSAVVSLASETLDDDEDPVDVEFTEASDPRGDVLLLAGEALLGDASDCWAARLWTDRSRSERTPALLTGGCGVIQNDDELVTLLLPCVGE